MGGENLVGLRVSLCLGHFEAFVLSPVVDRTVFARVDPCLCKFNYVFAPRPNVSFLNNGWCLFTSIKVVFSGTPIKVFFSGTLIDANF